MSQKESVLEYLKSRKQLTPLEALKRGDAFGVFVFIADEGRALAGYRRLRLHCPFCSTEKIMSLSNAQKAKSCGCLTKQILRAARTTHGHSRAGKGDGSLTYKSWRSMWERCTNDRHKSYPDYGGRGIKICGRWGSFENFLADMGERPKGRTLSRIDNSGNYEPGNCCWDTYRSQANNRRSSRLLTFGERTMTLSEWAREVGMGNDTLAHRLRSGWTVPAALTTPMRITSYSRCVKKAA